MWSDDDIKEAQTIEITLLSPAETDLPIRKRILKKRLERVWYPAKCRQLTHSETNIIDLFRAMLDCDPDKSLADRLKFYSPSRLTVNFSPRPHLSDPKTSNTFSLSSKVILFIVKKLFRRFKFTPRLKRLFVDYVGDYVTFCDPSFDPHLLNQTHDSPTRCPKSHQFIKKAVRYLNRLLTLGHELLNFYHSTDLKDMTQK